MKIRVFDEGFSDQHVTTALKTSACDRMCRHVRSAKVWIPTVFSYEIVLAAISSSATRVQVPVLPGVRNHPEGNLPFSGDCKRWRGFKGFGTA